MLKEAKSPLRIPESLDNPLVLETMSDKALPEVDQSMLSEVKNENSIDMP